MLSLKIVLIAFLLLQLVSIILNIALLSIQGSDVEKRQRDILISSLAMTSAALVLGLVFGWKMMKSPVLENQIFEAEASAAKEGDLSTFQITGEN
mgnify:CR=1 FL=1